MYVSRTPRGAESTRVPGKATPAVVSPGTPIQEKSPLAAFNRNLYMATELLSDSLEVSLVAQTDYSTGVLLCQPLYKNASWDADEEWQEETGSSSLLWRAENQRVGVL